MLITVDSCALKSAFLDIDKLKCETVSFMTEDNKLIITAGTSVIYEDIIDIKESISYMDTVSNVQYVNLGALLGDRGEATIDFGQFSIDIKYKTISLSMTISDCVVQRPAEDIGNKVPITDRDSLTSALSIFKGLGIFQKTLQMERPLQLNGSYGVIQFPTVWVRVRSSGITGVITGEQATVIANFKPDYVSTSNVITLYRDNAKLTLPLVAVPDGDEYMEMINTMQSYGVKETHGLLARVKRLSSTLGVCNCSVYVGAKTLHFTITKNNVSITDKADEEIQYSFDTRLEYMVSILSMIGSDNSMEILANSDDVVCLRNADVSIILSTGR